MDTKREYGAERTLEPLLTPRQVAEALAISRPSVYRLIETGELEAVRVGSRSTRFAPEDVRRFVERRRVGGDAAG
jgi:excisionase family DNA binding protein